MKADKLLFGATCIGMGLLINSVANKNDTTTVQKQTPKTTILGDTIGLKTLTADTLDLSHALKSDTLKLIKKAK